MQDGLIMGLHPAFLLSVVTFFNKSLVDCQICHTFVVEKFNHHKLILWSSYFIMCGNISYFPCGS